MQTEQDSNLGWSDLVISVLTDGATECSMNVLSLKRIKKKIDIVTSECKHGDPSSNLTVVANPKLILRAFSALHFDN